MRKGLRWVLFIPEEKAPASHQNVNFQQHLDPYCGTELPYRTFGSLRFLRSKLIFEADNASHSSWIRIYMSMTRSLFRIYIILIRNQRRARKTYKCARNRSVLKRHCINFLIIPNLFLWFKLNLNEELINISTIKKIKNIFKKIQKKRKLNKNIAHPNRARELLL